MVRFNQGDGTLGAAASYPDALWSTADVAAGDVNGDGVPDLVSAGQHPVLSDGYAIVHPANASTTPSAVTQGVLDLSSQNAALTELTNLDQYLSRVESERGAIGVFQSRISAILSTVCTTRDNLDAATEELTDADIAEESATLISSQIRQTAASAVLAQANQQPALALKLLGTGP